VTEVRDVADGLWIWRRAHPAWRPERWWQQTVTSTCVRSAGEVALLDPIAPDDDALRPRLDREPPTRVVVLKPDHVRDVDLFVHRSARGRVARPSRRVRAGPRPAGVGRRGRRLTAPYD
jgi:hypothetical protein